MFKTFCSSLNSVCHNKSLYSFTNLPSFQHAYSINFFSTRGKDSKKFNQNQSKGNPYGASNPRSPSSNPKKTDPKHSSSSTSYSHQSSIKTGSVKDMLKGSPAQSDHLKNKSSKNVVTDTILVDEQDRKAALLRESLKQARLEEENEEAENFKLDMPWDFKNIITRQPEGNLKSPVGIGRLLNYPVAIGLFKDFVQAIEEYDTERLEEILEYTFWERASKNLRKMKKKGYRFELEGMSSRKNQVDLFKVTNIYGVGIFTNRKFNEGANQYTIFENTIDGSPTANYIKIKMEEKEKAVVKVVLDLMVETPIKLKLFDKDGKQVESGSTIDREINFHHMRIENDVFEADYDALQLSAKNEGELEDDELNQFKSVFSHDGWKIIDMDNYMNGNPIVQARVVL